ncbi:unnamed protein product [Symbiodinium natans]|uniref:Uncharacterized protein n=1 Tax=Symbiodinium natans TaxID=878477 RepID=A0A812KC61_9DINO|nr:unnamed protein product [Symbiodinium natans]
MRAARIDLPRTAACKSYLIEDNPEDDDEDKKEEADEDAHNEEADEDAHNEDACSQEEGDQADEGAEADRDNQELQADEGCVAGEGEEEEEEVDDEIEEAEGEQEEEDHASKSEEHAKQLLETPVPPQEASSVATLGPYIFASCHEDVLHYLQPQFVCYCAVGQKPKLLQNPNEGQPPRLEGVVEGDLMPVYHEVIGNWLPVAPADRKNPRRSLAKEAST